MVASLSFKVILGDINEEEEIKQMHPNLQNKVKKGLPA
jgi:hypothetical protein